MKIRQWEVWKCQPEGFARDHWFVIVSGQERCDEPRQQRFVWWISAFSISVFACAPALTAREA